MNSDYFTICGSGFETKTAFDEMVDPSLYSSLDTDSPNSQLMYESIADFCTQTSGNLSGNIQKMNGSNINNIFLHHQQTQQPILQTIQFNQQLNFPNQENSSLISPTIEELTFEDCCSEMLKLLDENDFNSLVEMNSTTQNEIDNGKMNFQISSQPVSNINSTSSTDYILNNNYDFDECNNLQGSLLLNNNLTLAQLNSPDFNLNLFDSTLSEVVQPFKIMPVENLFVNNNPTNFNTLILDQKIMSPPLNEEFLQNNNLKQEPRETKLYTITYSAPVATNQPVETRQLLFASDNFANSECNNPNSKVILSSTLSPIQLKSILKGMNNAPKNFEQKSGEMDGMMTFDNNNNPPKPESSESVLEAYLMGSTKDQSKPSPQNVDNYEDLGPLWDICDEEEALSVNCDKKESLPEKTNTRKARKHLDSETSVDMTGDESDDQYQASDDEDEAAEFLQDLKNKDEGQRFFWQYNVLSKGPKGRRLCQSIENPDPHVLGDFQDPVFHQEQDRYKHNGKARRGDGNDVTPNPQKLFSTGIELQKLNKQINMMAPGNDWPTSQKNKTLKERNKLASRACRLKKKAQHEANKLKLHGLKLEHSQLMKVLSFVKELLSKRVRNKDTSDMSLIHQFNALSKKYHSSVAGRTAEYVNSVLAKVASGDRTGGINIRS